jgi:hypothetical protein
MKLKAQSAVNKTFSICMIIIMLIAIHQEITLSAVAADSAVALDLSSPVFPHIVLIPFQSQLQLQIWNTSDRQIQCSGPVFIYTNQNRTQIEQVFLTIWPRQFYTHFLYLNRQDPSEDVRSASHSLMCYATW